MLNRLIIFIIYFFGGQVSQVQKLKKLSLTEELRQMQHLTRFCISN